MRGWYPSAYIEARIHVSDSETVTVLHHTQLNSEASPITVSFGVNLLSNADATQWQYKADGTIPNGWNTASFTETWPAVPATAPSVSQNVWLFRRQITVSATTSFDGFVMRTKARGGVVVYLNGAEVVPNERGGSDYCFVHCYVRGGPACLENFLGRSRNGRSNNGSKHVRSGSCERGCFFSDAGRSVCDPFDCGSLSVAWSGVRRERLEPQ